MFTVNHFIWIAICALFIVVLTYFSLKNKFSYRTATFVMAGIAFASETSKILSHMEFVNGVDASEGMVIEATALPLHLCSVLIFAFFYLPFVKNEKLKNFILSLTVPVALVGGTMAILMATSSVRFDIVEPYQCFIYHSGVIWFAIYLIATKQVYLGKKAFFANALTLFAASVVMIWVNGALQAYDTNFLYVVRPPAENLPVLNLNHGWYVYYASLLVVGILGLGIVHLPFMLCEKKK